MRKKHPVFGIHWKLMAAFAAVLATTVISAMVGLWSNSRLSAMFAIVVEEHVPRLDAAAALSRSSLGVVLASGVLNAARNDKERQAAAISGAEDLQATAALVDRMRADGVDPAQLDAIVARIDSMGRNLRGLDKLVSARLVLAEAQHRQRDHMNAVRSAFSDSIAETLAKAENPAVQRMLLDLSASVTVLGNLLTEAAETADFDRLTEVRQRIGKAMKATEDAAKGLADHRREYGEVAEQAVGILDFGRGNESIPALRFEHLKLSNRGMLLLDKNREIAGELTAVVNTVEAGIKGQITESARKITTSVADSRKILLAAIAVGTLIAALIVFVYVRRHIIHRLAALSSTMRALAEGNLEIEPPHASRDEIGDMAAALAVLRAGALEMRALQSRVDAERRHASEERRRIQLELADAFEVNVKSVVEQTRLVMGKLQTTVDGLSHGARGASEDAGEAAAASRQAMVNVNSIAAASEQLLASITEIARQVHHSSGVTERAVADVKRTNGMIVGLNETARRISSVVELINAIAKQTHLLALNATIEAARAGEAGRGFSVVAGEVKALASQTARATDDIGQHVAAIQTRTEAAVLMIVDISRTVDQVYGISSAIAAAVEEQSAATQEIARNVAAAAMETTSALATSQRASDACHESNSLTTRALGATNEMAGHVNVLDTEVKRFIGTIRS
ncbi:methyl-accepting chemotaxis protein [Azospirillum melinis]|nr:methyl-accepting chemotaxis protein [Azospirillum melinis]MBP2310630.1 methyl-accepting chemotaxis protein [Azospirillum melinis]